MVFIKAISQALWFYYWKKIDFYATVERSELVATKVFNIFTKSNTWIFIALVTTIFLNIKSLMYFLSA